MQRKPEIRADAGKKADGPYDDRPGAFPEFPADGNWGDWCMPRGTDIPVFGTDEHGFWIQGDGTDLYQLEHRSTLLRRQQEFDFSMSAWFVIPELGAGEDAGLTCYYDENSFMKFGLARRQGKLGIMVEEFVDDGYISCFFLPCPEKKSVQLRIETGFLKRVCLYRFEEGEDWRKAAALDNTGYLCSEGLKKGKRFTGAMAGFYVHGSGNAYVRDFCLSFKCEGKENERE